MLRRLAWLLVLVPLVLPMGALALATLQADPSSVSFGARCVRSEGSARVTVTNEGSPEAVDVRVSVSPSSLAGVFRLAGTTSAARLDPGERIAFTVRFSPVQSGAVSANAVVTYDAIEYVEPKAPGARPPKPSNSGSPSPSPTETSSPTPDPTPSPSPSPSPSPVPKTRKIALSGSGIDRFIGTSPSALGFGSVRLGQSAARKTLRVYADGVAPVNIRSIAIEGRHAADFTLEGARTGELRAGEPLALTVGFRGQTLGARHADLVIRSDACEDATLRVPLGGAVVEPDIFVDPPEIVFEPVEVGASSQAERVLVVNQGGDPLEVRAIEVQGEDFRLASEVQLPRTLDPAEAIPVRLVFAPTAAGTREATLHVESADPDAPALDVRIIGEGDAGEGTQAVPPVGGSDAVAAPVATGLDAYAPELVVVASVVVFFSVLTIVRRLRGRAA